jgi:uncharacterized protein YndB with AHSA1/START domain
MTTFSIYKQISIDVPPSVIFDALTNSEKIVNYYPLKEVISSWKVGSEIILKGSNGEQDFTDYGTIEILLPNEKFQYTYWSDNHGTVRAPENRADCSVVCRKNILKRKESERANKLVY